MRYPLLTAHMNLEPTITSQLVLLASKKVSFENHLGFMCVHSLVSPGLWERPHLFSSLLPHTWIAHRTPQVHGEHHMNECWNLFLGCNQKQTRTAEITEWNGYISVKFAGALAACCAALSQVQFL